MRQACSCLKALLSLGLGFLLKVFALLTLSFLSALCLHYLLTKAYLTTRLNLEPLPYPELLIELPDSNFFSPQHLPPSEMLYKFYVYCLSSPNEM